MPQAPAAKRLFSRAASHIGTKCLLLRREASAIPRPKGAGGGVFMTLPLARADASAGFLGSCLWVFRGRQPFIATLIYRRTKNHRAVHILLVHTKLDYLPRRTMSRADLRRPYLPGAVDDFAEHCHPLCRAIPPARRSSWNSPTRYLCI